MGWLGNAMAVALALVLWDVGAWELSLVIFALLLVPALLRTRKGGGAPQDAGKTAGRFPFRYLLGGVLFLFALIGIMVHGSFSPLAFGSVGLVVMAWGRVPAPGLGSGLREVEESILLRSSPLPVSWAAVAEVKPLTRDVGRALAGLDGTVVVSASDAPTIHVVVERTAFTERAAEEAVLAALRETALSLSPLGAYLLPLDSKQALALLQPSLEASGKVAGDWYSSLASGSYDVVCIRQSKGFARSLGLYKKVGEEREGRGTVPPFAKELPHPPLVIEVFKAFGSRLTWPGPDQYTAFLSSLLATSGEPIGTRILDAGASSQSQTVLVRSQASPPVELSRAQLRAVAKIYVKETE